MGVWWVCGFMEGGRGDGEGKAGREGREGREAGKAGSWGVGERGRGVERLRSGIVVCVSVDVRRTELLVVVC